MAQPQCAKGVEGLKSDGIAGLGTINALAARVGDGAPTLYDSNGLTGDVSRSS